MEVKYLVMIVFFYCSTILLEASQVVSRVANFRVLHRRPGLRKCAVDILNQNGLVGGRVSNVTGVCEGLQHSWAFNQTMQNGYTYLKTDHAKQKYHPPLKAAEKEFQEVPAWLVPGVLREGAEISVTILNDNWFKEYLGLSVKLVNSTDRHTNVFGNDPFTHVFRFWSRISASAFYHDFGVSEQYLDGRYDIRKRTTSVRLKNREVKKRKFTLQALTNGFKCLLDGEEILTYRRENFDPKIMRQVYVQYTHWVETQETASVHSFEFREHVEG